MTFDDFWKAYPHHIAKRAALRAWEKLSADEREAAMKAIPLHRSKWAQLGWYTPPHPSSWLNGARWEDELDAPAKGVLQIVKTCGHCGQPAATWTSSRYGPLCDACYRGRDEWEK